MRPLTYFMPTCHDIYEEASAFLGDEMSWWRRAMFRMHLSMCDVCQEVVRQFDLVIRSAAEAVDSTVDELDADVRASLLDEFRASRVD